MPGAVRVQPVAAAAAETVRQQRLLPASNPPTVPPRPKEQGGETGGHRGSRTTEPNPRPKARDRDTGRDRDMGRDITDSASTSVGGSAGPSQPSTRGSGSGSGGSLPSGGHGTHHRDRTPQQDRLEGVLLEAAGAGPRQADKHDGTLAAPGGPGYRGWSPAVVPGHVMDAGSSSHRLVGEGVGEDDDEDDVLGAGGDGEPTEAQRRRARGEVSPTRAPRGREARGRGGR